MAFKTHKLALVIFNKATAFITAVLLSYMFIVPAQALAAQSINSQIPTTIASSAPSQSGKYYCGGGKEAVRVSINFGCQGKGNPIMDMLFAIIRLLSDGVGLVVIASLIVAGIQYTSSRGDPQLTAKAVHRLQSNVTALVIFFFAYAILNYLIPGQVL